jgi:hypothetical protein
VVYGLEQIHSHLAAIADDHVGSALAQHLQGIGRDIALANQVQNRVGADSVGLLEDSADSAVRAGQDDLVRAERLGKGDSLRPGGDDHDPGWS